MDGGDADYFHAAGYIGNGMNFRSWKSAPVGPDWDCYLYRLIGQIEFGSMQVLLPTYQA